MLRKRGGRALRRCPELQKAPNPVSAKELFRDNLLLWLGMDLRAHLVLQGSTSLPTTS